MKRRSFLKTASAASFVTIVTPSGIINSFMPTTANDLEKAFVNPANVSKPFTWWHWMNGNISRKGITLDLEAMQRVGVGGVQCFNVGDGIPAGPVNYLSEEWNDLTRHAINEAGRLGLQFDMHNCPGWSSTAGPWITPEVGMQQITWSETFVDGGQQIKLILPKPAALLNYYQDTYVIAYPTLSGEQSGQISVLADWKDKANFPKKSLVKMPGGKGKGVKPSDNLSSDAVVNPETVIDLRENMDASGNLTWDAPAGKWTILRIGHTVIEQINHAPPKSGTGLECDKYSREAFKFHFDKVFEHLMPTFQKWVKSSKIGMLIDSYEVGLQNWTPKLPQEFEARRGYPLLSYLPAVAGRIVGSADDTERFYYDFRKTHADLMAANYYGYFDELCKEHNIISYTEPYRGGPFDQIEAGSKTDIPMGEFWIRGPFFLPSLKLASSISHVFGKRMDGLQIVGAESYTGDPAHSKWQEYPYSLKGQGDLMMTYGLNRFIFHRYAHQPHSTVKPGMTMGPHGFHFDRTNTWFEQSKAWLNYIGRSQALLQRGLFCADILYFGGEDQPGDDLSRMVEFEPKPPVGYDWDRTNKEGLLTRVAIKGNSIVLPDGVTYKVLVLVPKPAMSLETLQRISELVHKGMILIGNPPKTTPGLNNSAKEEQQLTQLVEALWGTNLKSAQAGRRVGTGLVYSQQPLRPILESLKIYPDAEFFSRSGDALINYIHRRIDDADVYFVANRRRTTEEITASFRVSGRQPELWDAATGQITPISVYQTAGSITTVPMQLDPYGSCFVVFRKPANANAVTSVERQGKALVSMQRFAEPKRGKYNNLTSSFSITAWVKPETDDKLDGEFIGKQISSYLLYPPKGELLYGKGHSACGLVVARNGIILCERTSGYLKSVLTVPVALSGWTHLALVHNSGVPSIFVNGKLLKTGTKSPNLVHPGEGDYEQDASAWLFEGDVVGLKVTGSALSAAQISQMASVAVPAPSAPLPVQLFTGKKGILFNQNGAYTLKRGALAKPLQVTDIPAPINLSNKWNLNFPPDHGAPMQIQLATLISLHKHPVDGVKYFSGTVTYTRQFEVPSGWLKKGHRLFLDLGRVEVLAEVKINGKDKGIVWKAPYSVEVTGDVVAGKNTLVVEVTNLWPNRLIGDEQQPAEYVYGRAADKALADNKEVRDAPEATGGIAEIPEWYLKDEPKPKSTRVAFTTWKHFTKDSPLLESGLVGPVILRAGYHLDV